MSARPTIDVSGLPKHRFDTHAPIWWGNLWLLAIETSMFVIALAAYLYTQQNFQVWPPPNTSTVYGLDPVPGLTPGTVNVILLVLSCVPMILVLHTLHLLTTWGEAVLLSSWVWTQPLDMHRRVDISVLAVYWYWVVGIWVPFYVVLYFAPRWI